MSTWKVAAAALPVGLVSIGTGLLVLRQARVSSPPAPMSAHNIVNRAIGAEPRTALDTQRTFGPPHTYRNLTVMPVYDASAVASDTYITLDEGLRAKTVRVQESKEGGDVNTLYITNRDKKPLYVMAGEVVLGGQQDRTIGKDLIVPAGKTRVPIAVFCVEHGRWTGRADFESSAQSVAAADIRLNAQDGNFKAEHQLALAQSRMAGHIAGLPARTDSAANSYGVAGTPPAERNTLNAPAAVAADSGRNVAQAQINVRPLARVANPALANSMTNAEAAPTEDVGASASEEVGKAQQQVWDKVATKNARFKTTSVTGTYRAALNMADGGVSKSAPAYVRALSGRLGHDPHLVGVVAVVNGRIVATDIFGDTVLFQKLWPKLLRSYAADAVEHAFESKPQTAAITPAQVSDFYARAVNGKTRAENKAEASANVRLESSEATTFRVLAAGTEKASAAGAAASKPLHETVLRK